jgi:hypothetical protein
VFQKVEDGIGEGNQLVERKIRPTIYDTRVKTPYSRMHAVLVRRSTTWPALRGVYTVRTVV